MEEEKNHSFGGLAFVACMFIGAGIGMIFHHTGAGGFIGMGVGFLVMGFLRTKNIKATPVTIAFPRTFGRAILTVIGLLMIAGGLSILFDLDILYPYGVGIGLILLGVFILVPALFKWKENK
jgi:hypothetical protein